MNASGERSALGSTLLSEDERAAFGARLVAFREAKGLSQAEFGDRSGMSKQTIARYESGERLPDLEGLYALAGAAGVDIEVLISTAYKGGGGGMTTLQAEEAAQARFDQKYPPTPGIVWVPRFDIKAAAGRGYINDTEDLIDKLAFRAWWVVDELQVEPEWLFICTVVGDSMKPLIDNGEDALGYRKVRQFIGETVYLVRLHGGLLIKQIERAGVGELRLVSRNPAYRDIVVPEPDIAREQGFDFEIVAQMLGKPSFTRF